MVVDRCYQQFGLFGVGVNDEPGSSGDDEATRGSVVVLTRIVQTQDKGLIDVSKAPASHGVPHAVGLLVGDH